MNEVNSLNNTNNELSDILIEFVTEEEELAALKDLEELKDGSGSYNDMEYATQYTLNILNSRDTEQEIKVIQDFRSRYPLAKRALAFNGASYIATNWKTYNEDMLNFSQLHPKVIFMLFAKGQDDLDITKHYYIDGRVQHCKARIIFPKFDRKKLR